MECLLVKWYQQNVSNKYADRESTARFPLSEFVRANREKSNLIGWRQTLTTTPPNHIRLLLFHAKKIAKWKTGLPRAYVLLGWRKEVPDKRPVQYCNIIGAHLVRQ